MILALIIMMAYLFAAFSVVYWFVKLACWLFAMAFSIKLVACVFVMVLILLGFGALLAEDNNDI